MSRTRKIPRTVEEQMKIRDKRREEYLKEEARLEEMINAPNVISLHTAGGDTTDFVVVGVNPETGKFDTPTRMIRIPAHYEEFARKAIPGMNVWYSRMVRGVIERTRVEVMKEFGLVEAGMVVKKS